jgi:thiosulfate/3-mercaptopyruvate sulfurtransferase
MTVELPEPLVSPEWLAEHIGDAGLVIADVRWLPGEPAGAVRAAFERGHIPGAVSFEIDTDLSAPPGGGGGRHPLPSSDAFAATMASAGIGDDTKVVAYDDVRGSYAARLWWMLDATGHRVALLDGGLQAWTGATESGPAGHREPAAFSVGEWPAVGPDAVVDALRDRTGPVLDARAADRYRGEVEPFDRVAGHVPGALSAPWADNLDPATGRFLGSGQLRERYAALGVTDASRAIAYCGSGVTASHDLIAMRIAGLGTGRLFAGSWSGWIEDGTRPVGSGSEP